MKKRVIIIPSCILLSLGLGVGTFFLVNYIRRPIVPPRPPEDELDKLEDDQEALMSKYMAHYFDSPTQLLDAFTPHELVNISINHVKQADDYISIHKGYADAFIVHQPINACYLKNSSDYFGKSNYFSEYVSKSLVKSAACRSYGNDLNYRYRMAKDDNVIDEFSAKWTACEEEKVNNVTYRKSFGSCLDRPLSYIISNQSIIKDQCYATYDADKKVFNVELNLDPVNSTRRYVLQMVRNGGLETDPVFESLNLKFIINYEDMVLTELNIDEKYTVLQYGLNIPTHAIGNRKWNYDVSRCKIPSLTENVNYNILEE